MAKLIDISINLSKIDKTKIINGEKGKYLNLTVALNDEKDQYGNDVSAWQGKSKEERQAGNNKNYLGKGKVFWSSENNTTSDPQSNYTPGDEDDLPF